MNAHARTIEPDFGSLLDADDDTDLKAETTPETRPGSRTNADRAGKPGFSLRPDDRIGGGTPAYGQTASGLPVAEESGVSSLVGVWGGLWRAGVIGIVAGTVGGIVGAFTLVWLTGAGWTVFARLLIDAISGHI